MKGTRIQLTIKLLHNSDVLLDRGQTGVHYKKWTASIPQETTAIITTINNQNNIKKH